jgi:hypothetical protein
LDVYREVRAVEGDRNTRRRSETLGELAGTPNSALWTLEGTYGRNSPEVTFVALGRTDDRRSGP